MLTVLLLCGLAFVAAQEPRPCNSPAQFEGRFYSRDFSQNFTQYARIAYDEPNKRVRELEEEEIGSEREFYERIFLHASNREYRINLRTHNCTSSVLTRPWIPFGVPSEAKFRGSEVVGPTNIPNEHVTAAFFDGRTTNGGDYFGTVTQPDCLPISFGYRDSRVGFFHRTFLDISIGIYDPDVFIPPPGC